MSNEDKLKKLFQQAAEGAAKDELTPKPTIDVDIEAAKRGELPTYAENLKKAIAITESGKTKWELLSERMTNGDLMDRFQSELDGLSGREYVRVYMKMLEYFKPKVVRVEQKPLTEEDRTIRIEVINKHPEDKGDNNIIDITPDVE